MSMEALRARLSTNSALFPPEMMNQDSGRHLFGPVPGVRLFDKWKTREECSRAGVHRPLYAGIDATKMGGISICVSSGYENEDHGEVIIYIGTGGRENPFSGSRGGLVEDQSFNHRMNNNLRQSLVHKLPIRVIRGPSPYSKYAPAEGYRYDGEYDLVQAGYGKSRDGSVTVCKFELRRRPGQAPIPIRMT